MKSFILKNLIQGCTVHKGASGTNYVIYRGQPFNVEIEQDIEYFSNNKRFGSSDGKLNGPGITVDQDLVEKLDSIKGLTKKSKELICKRYRSFKDVEFEMNKLDSLSVDISGSQQEKLRKHFGLEYDD